MELARVAQQQVAEGTLALADVQAVANAGADPSAPSPAQSQQANLNAALKQLESEPTDAATCAAKFELYEGFAKLTENARAAVTELAASSQADLAASSAHATAAQVAREVAQIDKPQNLGIVDDGRGRWFVHGMCTAAVKNHRLLDGVLTGIQRKLELLASQTDCPVCFEPFAEESRPAVALSCAHKVCGECWEHWSAMAHGSVVLCPLCRHEEFLEQVMRAAEAPAPMDVN